MFSLVQITAWLIAYKYFFIFLIIAVEGPIATIIIGSLSAAGIFNFFLAYLVVIIGDLSGDLILYSFGRWGGRSRLEKWGRYFGIKKDQINKIEGHYVKYTGRTLMIGKISHGIGAIFLIGAGVGKVPLFKFLGYNFLATLAKSFILMLIGFYFGSAITRINKYLDYTVIVTFSLGIIILVSYLLVKKRLSNLEDK